MRGPLDDKLVVSDAIGREEGAEDARLPGGKALRRLLYFMGRRGETHSAHLLLERALEEDQGPQMRSFLAAYTPSDSSAHAAGGSGDEDPELRLQTSVRYAQERLQAITQMGPPTGPPSGSGPQWRSLGPTTIPNGQTYGSSRINVSGRVSCVAVDPGNPAHVLCGAAGGGVWESFDRGATWAPRTDFAPSLATGAIAFDPTNSHTVYCGTGEGNFYSTLGAGVLKSSDGGTTWTSIYTGSFVGQGFYDLRVHPANNQQLFGALTNGLWISTNGGTSWTQKRGSATYSISIAPSGGVNAQILAAASDGVWQSTDGGNTWSQVTLPGAPSSFHRLAVAHAPSNATTIYVFGSGPPQIPIPGDSNPKDTMGTPYLWRHTGSGAYTAFSPPTSLTTTQDWYDWFLAVAPDRDSQIYVGAIDSWRGDLSGSTWSWTALSAKSGTGTSSIHPDQHAIAFEPGNPNMVYIGSDGGLFRSPDRGITWVSCNNGLVITEFEYIAQNPGASRWIIGGTQDNGTDRFTGNSAWDHVDDGDGGDCAVNRSDPTIVFHEFYDISPVKSTSSGDWGSWSGMSLPVPKGEGSLFYCPYTCSATDGDTVALGTTALYISRDNGASWVRLALPSATASALYIPNPDNVYVGTTDGRVFHSQWSGSSWPAPSALTTPRAGGYLSSLYVNPNNLNQIWATYSNLANGGNKLVFSSSDGGSTWTDRSAGLPNQPVNAVEVDSRNANRIWVGNDTGVFQSLNAGATWTNFSNGLPNVLVGDLSFHPNAWVLRAGTRNRGVWEIPVDGWMTAPACGLQFTGSLAPNQTQRWFTFNWPATWHVVWTVMPTTINTSSPQITWTVEVQRASGEFVTYWIQVQNLTNSTVAFEGRFCILSRY